MISLKSKKPLIISGPCSAETQEQLTDTCIALAKTGTVDVLRAGIWKPRTKPGSFEGVGEDALKWFAQIKKDTGLPIATEVANAKHVELALKHGVDILWIGARTTVNPFSVQEIADAIKGSNVPVLVKNPMNPDIDLWQGALERLLAVGINDVGMIHRGFSSYGATQFRNSPQWHIAIEMRRRMQGMPMICDPSHICGNREWLQQISQKSADLSYDGLIIESHINPCDAWSDASQQVTPSALADLVRSIVWRDEKNNSPEYVQALDNLRGQIDLLDGELLDILSKRMSVAGKIGEVKRDNNVAILQSNRWGDILESLTSKADKLELSKDFLVRILDNIHVESINIQNNIMNKK